MTTPSRVLIDLENRFWQSMVDQDVDAALELLQQPAFMVSSHGTLKFDHAGYRRMAERSAMTVESFQLDDVQTHFPNETTAILTYRVRQKVAARKDGKTSEAVMNDSSTWIRTGDGWKCVMHTETPAPSPPPEA